MTEHESALNRRTVLETIGGTAIAVGAYSGGASADNQCDATVEAGDSIQAIISAADEGDTVCVKPGRYEENIVIDKDNITLTGRRNAVVEGTGFSGAAISIEADGVTVERLRVQHPGGNLGIASREDLDGVTIRDNRVSDIGPWGSAGPTGILAEAQTGLTVANNRVSDITETVVSAQGIFLNNDHGQVIEGDIVGNSVSDIFIDDDGWGGAMGILVQTSGAMIRNNDVQDLTGSWAQGVNVHGGNEATVRDNHLEGMTGRNFEGESVKIESGGTSDINVTQNNLLATVGVFNDSDDELDATCNYWGAHNGPDAADNDGDGSAVEGNVEYRPWKVGRGRGNNCRGE